MVEEGKMIKDVDAETPGPGCSMGACLLWFMGGISLSFLAISSVVLLALLLISMALNAYLSWELSGLVITISRPTLVVPEVTMPTPTTLLVESTADSSELASADITGTPTPVPPEVQLEKQVSTLAAIATSALQTEIELPPGTPLPALAAPPESTASDNLAAGLGDGADLASAFSPPTSEPTAEPIGGSNAGTSGDSAIAAAAVQPISKNSYTLIPIDGERDSRPGDEHGDLNLKLRDPQPIEVELSLVDAGVGVDPDALKLSAIFEPNFVAAYTVHNWDWGCNCKGDLIQEDDVVLVGLKTTPGEPIFIPPRQQDIYDGKYYAVLLYASEDSVTFLYARAGTVAMGYSVHYIGLQTDPNLLALYRESPGNQLPGLTLDTPIGIATAELIVAIRDNGIFLDARSKNDWWD
jgi:hypothetical protein